MSTTSLTDNRVNAKPKYEYPNAIVSIEFLDRAFTMSRAGCPVEGCGKLITSHSIRVDASGAKCTFLCSKGHPTSWSSSQQIGRQMLLINKLVPAAAVMSGLKLAPMKRFLGLLSVDSQDPDYMKASSLDVLIRLTNDLFAAEVEKVRQEMLTEKEFDCGTLPGFFFFLLTYFYFSAFVLFLLKSSHG